MSVCPCASVCAPGGRALQLLPPWSGERARELEQAIGKGGQRGAGEAAQPSRGRRRAATMLNNLTDCEDGDGGANPGKQWSGGGGGGGGEEEGSFGVRGGAGAASYREEPGTDPGCGCGRPRGGLLHWNALGAVRGSGMRRAPRQIGDPGLG